MINLTAKDSPVSITAVERDGDIDIFVDSVKMRTMQDAASTAGVDVSELRHELCRRGLLKYLFESAMLADYSADYWLAAATLSSTQSFKPPFLFLLGHAFELTMKGVLVYKKRKPIAEVAKEYRHNLSSLWQDASGLLNEVPLHSTTGLINSYSTVYSGKIDNANYFARYPDWTHLRGKWPDSIVESVNPIANDAWLIIQWLNSEFRNSDWQYKEWPNKTVNWTP